MHSVSRDAIMEEVLTETYPERIFHSFRQGKHSAESAELTAERIDLTVILRTDSFRDRPSPTLRTSEIPRDQKDGTSYDSHPSERS